MFGNKKIKVIIVDESAVVRAALTKALKESGNIDVLASAFDPYVAVYKIKRFEPDVIILDINLPRMDSLTFLSKLMMSKPTAVIMSSSDSKVDSNRTIRALSIGAVDFIVKPKINAGGESWKAFSELLMQKVMSASSVDVWKGRKAVQDIDTAFFGDKNLKKGQVEKKPSGHIFAIGASTGGTVVVNDILKRLPEMSPAVLIVQHIPPVFSKSFAENLNRSSSLYVKEAENGDPLFRGMAYVAPGDYHMLLRKKGGGLYLEINQEEKVNRFRPSVDVMFRSVVEAGPEGAVGVLLTGMGGDGSEGLLDMKNGNYTTIAQDESSSTVFGMPREAIMKGAADYVLGIEKIAEYLENYAAANNYV